MDITGATAQYWIEPASTQSLPSPAELRELIRANLERGYQALRRAQGDIHTPEDTFRTQRALAATYERFTDWSRAFREGATRIAQMQEEQLIEAVGERVSTVTQVGIDGEPEQRGTGVPNQGLTVPDAAGDVRLSVDFKTERDFDLDQLIAVVVADTLESWSYGREPDPAGRVEQAIRTFLELGKFEPQVSKVNVYAKGLARNGDDSMSSVVTGAVTARKVYQGVSMKRS